MSRVTKSEPLKAGQDPEFHQTLWRRIMLKKIAILAFATLASPALANGLPQTQDDWFVNSGRYLDGQIVSYNQAPSQRPIIAYAGSRRHARMIEGRAAAMVGMSWSFPQSSWGREQMVSATGN
jgi:hypothetical protein